MSYDKVRCVILIVAFIIHSAIGTNQGFQCNVFVSHSGNDSPVCGGLESPCASIQQAVFIAEDNATVCVQAEPEPYSCGVLVNKSLCILSINGFATIDCKSQARAFNFTSMAASLVGFHIRNGAADGGGAIAFVGGSMLWVENCTFEGNIATSQMVACGLSGGGVAGGGAILFRDPYGIGHATFVRNVFTNNSALSKGGSVLIAYSNDIAEAEVHFFDNHFASNSVGLSGGAIAVRYEGTATSSATIFINNTFLNNTANFGGGVVVIHCTPGGGNVDNFTGNTFTGNTAVGPYSGGGAVLLEYQGGCQGNTYIFDSNTVAYGKAEYGGGIHCRTQQFSYNCSSHFINNKVIGNAANYAGGVFIEYDAEDIPGIANASNHIFTGNTISNNTSSFQGGGVFLSYYGNATANNHLFSGNTISNNTSSFQGGGIFFVYTIGINNTHSFDFNWITGNTAIQGAGVLVINANDVIETCDSREYTPNQVYTSWTYSNFNTFSHNHFENNDASFGGKGGALSLSSGLTVVDSCIFNNNSATLGGSLLLTGDSTALKSINTTFHGTDSSDIWSVSMGILFLQNTTFVSRNPKSAFFEVTLGGNVTLLETLEECPVGCTFADRSIAPFNDTYDPYPSCGVLHCIVSFQCQPCEQGFYSLEAGSSRYNPNCNPCPYGASCELGGNYVTSLPGFWCFEVGDSHKLECMFCPDGFCSQNGKSIWTDSCTVTRTGTLCGECIGGYSEALGSDECVPDEDCTAVYWFFPAAFAVAAVYVLFITWLPVRDHPLWKSISYFMQVAPLLVGFDNKAVRTLLAMFTLDPSILGIHVAVCPWPAVTAIQKMAVDFLLPVALVVVLAAMYGIHRILRKGQAFLQRRNRRHVASQYLLVGDQLSGKSHALSEYTGALMALLLLMYEGLSSAVMDLLNCVDVNGELRLFRAGYVTCYTHWQYPLFVLLGTVLVPFPLMLVYLRWFLHKHEASPNANSVLDVLEKPYSLHCLWWESFGMLRRLVLVSAFTFIPDSLWRSLVLCSGCFFITLANMYFKPYRKKNYQRAETAFLCNLTLISALQIPRAVYTGIGLVFDGTLTADALEWLEGALALLPLAYCLWVASVEQFRRLMRWKKGSHRKNAVDASIAITEAQDWVNDSVVIPSEPDLELLHQTVQKLREHHEELQEQLRLQSINQEREAADHKEQIKELERALETLKLVKERAEEDAANMKNCYNALVEEFRVQMRDCKRQMADLRVDFAVREKTLQEQFTEEMTLHRNEHESAMAIAIATLREQFAYDSDKMRAEHESELAMVRHQFEDQLDSYRGKCETLIAAERAQAADQLTALKDQLYKMLAEQASHEAE